MLPKYGNFSKNLNMGKNTSVSLGDHFESFVDKSIADGRYSNASEVIRAGLRLLEEEESRLSALKQAIQEGLDTGFTSFNPDMHLKALKARNQNG
jgi:antitoxin ParD1/3/4